MQHINMTTIAVLISLAVGVPVRIQSQEIRAAGVALTIADLMQSIPAWLLLAISVIFIGDRYQAGNNDGLCIYVSPLS